MSSLRGFLSIPPATDEQGWWPSQRWVLRRLALYAIAALSGGLLFVLCAALLAFLSPQGIPTKPAIPTGSTPPIAPPDTVIQKPPLIARGPESVKLVKIAMLIDNKDKDSHAIRNFIDEEGLVQKYPLGFALFAEERYFIGHQAVVELF
jgi:hypothetical protein